MHACKHTIQFVLRHENGCSVLSKVPSSCNLPLVEFLIYPPPPPHPTSPPGNNYMSKADAYDANRLASSITLLGTPAANMPYLDISH